MSVVYFTDHDLGLRFPETLRAAGLEVESHRDHFPPVAPDEDWLGVISARGWVAVTHDGRIRYKPNELAAVVRHRARVLVVVGKAPLPVLAQSFVQARRRIEAFLEANPAPLIGKVYRASPAELARNPDATDRVEIWYPGQPGTRTRRQS